MARTVVVDPTAPPAPTGTWVAPRVGRPRRGLTVGFRLDRSWQSYFVVLDAWEALLVADGASVARVVAEGRVASAGAQTRTDLDDWRRLVDCAVVGLGN